MSVRHFLTLEDLGREGVEEVLSLAARLKKDFRAGKRDDSLKGKILAMVFEKSSTRTRVSFEAAMLQLGGHAIHLDSTTSQLGRGESYEDTARVLSRYVNAIMLRTFDQENLRKMASVATVPVVNGLSDAYHPVQILAALQTILEKYPNLEERKIAYVGDGNNLTHSWIEAAKLLGFSLRVACPEGYGADAGILRDLQPGANVEFISDPEAAVQGVEVLYTDTWFSMGQSVSDEKRRLFAPYQVNDALLKHAAKEAMVLHCLPAHRDEEITSAVLDGPQSFVLDEAENRLHAQKALLKTLIA